LTARPVNTDDDTHIDSSITDGLQTNLTWKCRLSKHTNPEHSIHSHTLSGVTSALCC